MAATQHEVTPRLDLSQPKFDQSTYAGRAQHFFIVTNPLNLLKSSSELEKARDIVTRCKAGDALEGVTDEEIWCSKYVYDSAFHPDTGEKMLLIGRMSAQVPMNMTITGCMLTFYRTTPQAVFWQWTNQTFNAVVNYTNRSGDTPISLTRLATSYTLATSGAVVTAVGLNALVKRFPPVVGRFVPFCAVVAANAINIPSMRSYELTQGIPVYDKQGRRMGNSKEAAEKAIGQVLFSRICMALPVMSLPPLAMALFEKKPFMKKYPMMAVPMQIGMVGFMFVFVTPLCCALFPQRSSLAVQKLDGELQKQIQDLDPSVDTVYFNKGL